MLGSITVTFKTVVTETLTTKVTPTILQCLGVVFVTLKNQKQEVREVLTTTVIPILLEQTLRINPKMEDII